MTYHSTLGSIESWEYSRGVSEILNIFQADLGDTSLWPMQEISGTTISDESVGELDLTAASDVAGWYTEYGRGRMLDFKNNASYMLSRTDTAGFNIYINGVEVDDLDYAGGGGYAAMEDTTAGVRIARYDKANGNYVDGKVIWPFITAKELSADEVWWLTQRIYGLMEM